MFIKNKNLMSKSNGNFLAPRRKFIKTLFYTLAGLSFSQCWKGISKPVKAGEGIEKFFFKQENQNDLIIDIKSFGAKGNANHYNEEDAKYYEDPEFTVEASDDSDAIQTAIDSISEEESVTLLFSGNHLLSKGINIVNKNRLTLQGVVEKKIIPLNFQNNYGTNLNELAFCLSVRNCSFIKLDKLNFYFGSSSGRTSAVLLRNCTDSLVTECSIVAINESNLSSGLVIASNSKRILIYRNNFSGGDRTVYHPSWENRGFGIFVCGDDIDVNENSCSGWALGGIKAAANYFSSDGEEIMSHKISLTNNRLYNNSQVDLGITGICDGLIIRDNFCQSKPYEPAQAKWKRCNSIHLKSGLGAHQTKSNISQHRIINVLVSRNTCLSNVAIRSIDEVENYSVYSGGENWIKNVVVSENTIRGETAASEFKPQGISVRGAENVTITRNTILNTLSYPISVSCSYDINIVANSITNNHSLASYILLHDVDTIDESGRCYNVSIMTNLFKGREGTATDTIKFLSLYEKIHQSIYLIGNFDQKSDGFTYAGSNLVRNLVVSNNN